MTTNNKSGNFETSNNTNITHVIFTFIVSKLLHTKHGLKS